MANDRPPAAAIAETPIDRAFIQDAGDISAAPGTAQVYDVDKQFAKLCRQHALEQQAFIVVHQARQLELASQAIKQDVQQHMLVNAYTSWSMKYSMARHMQAAGMHKLIEQFVNLTIRAEWPKTAANIESSKEKAKKREDSLREANARFESLDPNAVAALAALEARKVAGTMSTPSNKQTTVPSGHLGAFLSISSPRTPCLLLSSTSMSRRPPTAAMLPAPKLRPNPNPNRLQGPDRLM